MRQSWTWLVSLLVLLLVTSCGPTQVSPSEVAQATPLQAAIDVIKNGGPERILVQVDYMLMPNCGPGEVEGVIERAWSVRHELTTEAGVEVTASGEVKVLGTGVDVGAAVAVKYGTTYGTEESIKRSLGFKVPAHTSARFDFQLVEIWQKGELVIRIGDQTQRLPYRFRQDFALELTGSQDIGCTIVTETARPTQVTAPTVLPPEQTPTPAPTGGVPQFGPVSFCLQIDADNRCVNPTSSLPSGTTKFYASWEFSNIPYGAAFNRIWYYNGNRVKYVDDVWDSAWGSPTGVEYTYYQYDPGFANGEYRVELYIDGQFLQAGVVRIGQ